MKKDEEGSLAGTLTTIGMKKDEEGNPMMTQSLSLRTKETLALKLKGSPILLVLELKGSPIPFPHVPETPEIEIEENVHVVLEEETRLLILRVLRRGKAILEGSLLILLLKKKRKKNQVTKLSPGRP